MWEGVGGEDYGEVWHSVTKGGGGCQKYWNKA